MNKWKKKFFHFFQTLFLQFQILFFPLLLYSLSSKENKNDFLRVDYLNNYETFEKT